MFLESSLNPEISGAYILTAKVDFVKNAHVIFIFRNFYGSANERYPVFFTFRGFGMTCHVGLLSVPSGTDNSGR